MAYLLKLDYATFNFAPEVTRKQISDCLAPGFDLSWQQFGRSENSPWASPFGLSYMDRSGYGVRPHCLRVSGVGCSKFLDRLLDLRELAENHLSRCDFAFDVVMDRQRWKELCSWAFNADFDESRKFKKVKLNGSGVESTIYIGSRRSPFYFRIYNKSLESPDYVALSVDGEPVQVGDNQFLIRYEFEYKRFRRMLRGEQQTYDPSLAFDSFFGDPSEVLDLVSSAWESYVLDLLPSDFELVVNDFSNKTQILLNNYDSERLCCVSADTALSNPLFDAPNSWDRTLHWVVDRFGSYVPFILNDRALFEECLIRFKLKFGFMPNFDVVRSSDSLECDDDMDVIFPNRLENIDYDWSLFDVSGSRSPGDEVSG